MESTDSLFREQSARKLNTENQMRKIRLNKTFKNIPQEKDMPPLEEFLSYFRNLNECTEEQNNETCLKLDKMYVNTDTVLIVQSFYDLTSNKLQQK